MDNEWGSIDTAKVHNNRRVRVPPAIRKKVVEVDRYKGQVVSWNHDTHADVMMISRDEIEGERYASPGSSQIHENQNTVTPPKELVDEIAQEFERFEPDDLFGSGKTVVYFATTGMTEYPASYYLMSMPRFFGMVDANSEEEGSLVQLLKSPTLS
jgi:hypothetical protein